eukprot:479535_1
MKKITKYLTCMSAMRVKQLYTIGILMCMWLFGSWWIYENIEDRALFVQHNKPASSTTGLHIHEYFSIANLANISTIKFEENEQNIASVNTRLLIDENLLNINNYEIKSDSKDKLKAKNFIDDIDLMYLDSGEKINMNYIWYNDELETVFFCIGVNTRLGNIMHEYLLAQSIAFFFQKKFKMVDPINYKTYQCSKTNLKRNLQYFYKYKDYKNNDTFWKQF